MVDQSTVHRQIEILGHKGQGFTEFRNLGSDKFVGINPRKTATGTTNSDVAKITCIVVDIDPTNNGEQAVDFAKTIALAENFASYAVISSGRGAHLYIPVDLSVDFSLRGYYEYLRSIYTREGYIIDKTHDLARIIRVLGSINSKNGKVCQIVEDKINGINQIDFKVIKDNVVTTTMSHTEETYANGSRNQILTSLAGSMRRRGISREGIEAALIEENKKCSPPLEEAEVKRIALSVSRYSPMVSTQNKATYRSMDTAYFEGLKKRTPGIMSGFSALDNMTAGVKPGNLWVVAARTNEGKTSFAIELSRRYAQAGHSILYFPTEIGSSAVYDKITASNTNINLRKFQFGDFTEVDLQIIQANAESLKNLPFFIAEDFGLVPEIIERKIEEMCPEVIVIDYIQALKYAEGGTPGEIGDAMRRIKELTSKYKVATILVSQLNRGADNATLSLSQLKGSGAIEEFADIVMLMVGLDKDQNPRTIDLHIKKSRYGEVGRLRYLFHTSYGKFEEI